MASNSSAFNYGPAKISRIRFLFSSLIWTRFGSEQNNVFFWPLKALLKILIETCQELAKRGMILISEPHEVIIFSSPASVA